MNSNCLEGRACPECGQEDKFFVEATTMITLIDNGIEDYGDCETGEDAYASCPDCDYNGIWESFKVQESSS